MAGYYLLIKQLTKNIFQLFKEQSNLDGEKQIEKYTDRRENETCENGAKKSKPFSSWLHIYLRTENPTDELLDLDMADKFDLGGGTFGGYPSNSKSFFFRHLLI